MHNYDILSLNQLKLRRIHLPLARLHKDSQKLANAVTQRATVTHHFINEG